MTSPAACTPGNNSLGDKPLNPLKRQEIPPNLRQNVYTRGPNQKRVFHPNGNKIQSGAAL